MCDERVPNAIIKISPSVSAHEKLVFNNSNMLILCAHKERPDKKLLNMQQHRMTIQMLSCRACVFFWHTRCYENRFSIYMLIYIRIITLYAARQDVGWLLLISISITHGNWSPAPAICLFCHRVTQSSCKSSG